ncbi:MAG TPA: bifunctional phosphoribosylaminoimidazolecarboxamide formyltransferase/IMP cyclohydrolase, partial [Wenzhouxiangella sp.]
MLPSNPTALISVSDKTGLVELGQALVSHGFRILSTGGSADRLIEAGIAVTKVSEHTGFPEIMGGRVKTLHPKIHGGILARRDMDQSVMADHGIDGIDLVVVNLYPFVEAIKDPNLSLPAAIEQIDIGGPAMIRSAAKNHQDVCVLSDPADYGDFIATLPHGPSLAQRQALAVKAFAHTAHYDGEISQWLSQKTAETEQVLPPKLSLSLDQSQALRYGENPHQAAGLYVIRGQDAPAGVAGGQLVQGKALSFNNLLDADAAWSALKLVAATDPSQSGCVIVKHTNPCGVALGSSALEAWEKALSCDPTSAFGGIVALSEPIDVPVAQQLVGRFLEVVMAPGITDEAKAVLASKPNLRVLIVASSQPTQWDLRAIDGGFLVQQSDHGAFDANDLSVVTQRAPSPEEIKNMLFAWAVVRSVRSNAIVYAKHGQTLGLGVGQMSRIDSARFGVLKSQ